METMKHFLDRDPSSLEHAVLLAWLTEPGRLGDLTLGASTADEASFGNQDLPEVPAEPFDERACVVGHHGSANVVAGIIGALYYSVRVLTPIAAFPFSSKPPVARFDIDALFTDLGKALKTRFGKPTRRTKASLRFEWDGGDASISRTSEELAAAPFTMRTLEVLYTGHAPASGGAAAIPETAAPKIDRPDPDALKAELNGVLPDCFDCGMTVTDVAVEGEALPFTVKIGIRFDPYTGTNETDEFALTVDGPGFDVCAAAIESMTEILGERT